MRAAPPVAHSDFVACMCSLTAGVAAVVSRSPGRSNRVQVRQVRHAPLLWEICGDGPERRLIDHPEQLPAVMVLSADAGWQIRRMRPGWWGRMLGRRDGWEITVPFWGER